MIVKKGHQTGSAACSPSQFSYQNLKLIFFSFKTSNLKLATKSILKMIILEITSRLAATAAAKRLGASTGQAAARWRAKDSSSAAPGLRASRERDRPRSATSEPKYRRDETQKLHTEADGPEDGHL